VHAKGVGWLLFDVLSVKFTPDDILIALLGDAAGDAREKEEWPK
jgi:hypothetical protein